MVLGLRHFSDRKEDGSGEPVLDTVNGEVLVHVQPGVTVVIGNCPSESPGTLYISSKKVVWLSDAGGAKGYAVDFLSISLHAVSRDPEAYPSPCIYTQIETEEADEDESDDSESESNEILDLSKVTEMRLVPSDPSQLDTLFQVFCQCAELNPEPVDEVDGGGSNWIFSADQLAGDDAGTRLATFFYLFFMSFSGLICNILVSPDDDDSNWNFFQNPTSSIGHSNGDHDVTRGVLELQINDQRFEDPEEMEEEDHSSHQ
ncbi:chloride conductance regulatory protein ICln isoform X1 [Mercurialis annua]|uniref:chloride conductance regulatory protein ICln isoform X1 n=1 Tax=Mercurialis annua TaxID=3986 RepID=UPI00215F3395|nr:chloride conductance regulatory protein ICln isoform X1 [Mercurialis annua]